MTDILPPINTPAVALTGVNAGRMDGAFYGPLQRTLTSFRAQIQTLTRVVSAVSDADGNLIASAGLLADTAELGAIRATLGGGLMVRTQLGDWFARALTGPAAGITVTFGDGFAGNPTLALANDLAALEGLAATGFAVRTGADAWTQRALAGTAGRITVTNGDGVAGAPTFDLATVADAGGGSLQKTAFDAYGRKTGTSAATTTDLPEGSNLYFTDARARTAAVADTITDAVTNIAPSQNAVFDALALKAAIPKGYIDGLQLQWVSGTALTVSSGAAYIEASANIVAAPSAIAKTSLSLSASTWYHVYLYLNAGTPDIEIVTTAPATAYSGTARSKSADTSRRYLGSVKTNAAGALIEFQQSNGTVSYGGADNNLRNVLSGGTSTVAVNVSLTSLVPVTATHAALLLSNTSNVAAGTGLPGSSNPTGFGAGKSYVGYAGPGNDTSFGAHPIDSSQQINYLMSAAPASGALYIDAIGYTFGR